MALNFPRNIPYEIADHLVTVTRPDDIITIGLRIGFCTEGIPIVLVYAALKPGHGLTAGWKIRFRGEKAIAAYELTNLIAEADGGSIQSEESAKFHVLAPSFFLRVPLTFYGQFQTEDVPDTRQLWTTLIFYHRHSLQYELVAADSSAYASDELEPLSDALSRSDAFYRSKHAHAVVFDSEGRWLGFTDGAGWPRFLSMQMIQELTAAVRLAAKKTSEIETHLQQLGTETYDEIMASLASSSDQIFVKRSLRRRIEAVDAEQRYYLVRSLERTPGVFVTQQLRGLAEASAERAPDFFRAKNSALRELVREKKLLPETLPLIVWVIFTGSSENVPANLQLEAFLRFLRTRVLASWADGKFHTLLCESPTLGSLFRDEPEKPLAATWFLEDLKATIVNGPAAAAEVPAMAAERQAREETAELFFKTMRAFHGDVANEGDARAVYGLLQKADEECSYILGYAGEIEGLIEKEEAVKREAWQAFIDKLGQCFPSNYSFDFVYKAASLARFWLVPPPLRGPHFPPWNAWL
jgi:hypothetical protein